MATPFNDANDENADPAYCETEVVGWLLKDAVEDEEAGLASVAPDSPPYSGGDDGGDDMSTGSPRDHFPRPRDETTPRAVGRSSEGGFEMTTHCPPPLTLYPRFDAQTVQRLVSGCPGVNLAGSHGGTIKHFGTRVLEECQLLGGVYAGMAEEYSYGRNTTGGYGRLYCSQGSQGLRSEIRRHLFPEYEDLDMKNAQPSILVQVMHELGYTGASGAILEYVTDRERCLEQLCASVNAADNSDEVSAGQAKELFLSVLFGGSLRRWTELHGSLSSATEHAAIADLVQAYSQQVATFVGWFEGRHGERVAAHDCRPTDQHAQSSTPHRHLSLYLQNEECFIMREVMRYVTDRLDGEVGVLIHDGCLVRFPDGGAFTARMLEALADYVEEQTGYRLEFTVKSMAPTMPLDELVADLRGERRTEPVQCPIYEPKENQDCLFLDYFLHHYGDRLKFAQDKKVYHYADETYEGSPLYGTWVEGPPPGVWWERLFPNTPYSQCCSKITAMRKELVARYPQYRRTIVWETYGPDWLPLEDMMLNMLTGDTCPITPDLMLTRKIPLKYSPRLLDPDDSSAEAAALVADNRNLYNGDEALENSIEERVAQAVLTRGNPHKILLNFVGAGNNGKSSVWMRALNCVGGAWLTTLSAKQLVGRQGATAANPHLRTALFSNLVIVEEPSKEDQMSCAFLKEISGNTPMKVRNLYENGNEDVANNAVFFFMSNHPFEVLHPDQALINRLQRIEMPCTFFPTAEARAQFLEHQEPLERAMVAPRCHLADPNFNLRYTELKMREAYLASLIRHYRRYAQRGEYAAVPEQYAYKKCDEEAALEKFSVQHHYESLFEETGDKNDFMTSSDIVEALKQRAKLDTNPIVIGKFMTGRIAKTANLQRKVANARKRQFRGYSGVRAKEMGGFGGDFMC